MKIKPATHLLRSDVFVTRARSETTDVVISYTDTTPDPRIDAAYLDYADAYRRYLGCTFHYVVKVSGEIEIGKDPRTISSRIQRPEQPHSILIGVVGGRGEDGKRVTTITQAQRDSVEDLIQSLADALQVPLGVTDYIADKQERDSLAALVEAEAEFEEQLDLAESN